MTQSGEQGPLLVITSSGGVLLDALALAGSYPGHRRHVAVDAPDTREALADVAVQFRREQSPGRPVALARELAFAVADLRRDPPGLVISAGTGLAVPWFTAARLLGIPRIWVETFNIVATQGIAARWCARAATLVAVQRPERVAAHSRSVLVGELM